MARKKGGKKKKRTDGVQTAQPDAEAEQKEPALSEAVSEVLGGDKPEKKEKKLSKKLKTQLAKFAANGHDVSELEAMVETASADGLKDAFREFEAGVAKIKEIQDAMSDMDLSGFGDEYEELNALLSKPMRHGDAAKIFDGMRFRHRSESILSELERMVLPSMKSRVEAMKSMLLNTSDLDAIEAEFASIRTDYKAAYAEDGVKAQIATSAGPGPQAKSRMPMVVKDIFLLYKDGKFISHHTNRVVSKEQQKELFADLKVGRDFLRSPKYQPQKLNVIPGRNRNILVQSGRFTVVIVVAEGSVDPWSEKITSKVITLMEKEDQMQLKDWNGDVSALKSSGKYMQALLFAFMKLAKKGQQ